MAEDSGQDRTEEPTAKKREQAKEKGQVARSKEFSSGVVLLLTVSIGYFLGASFTQPIINIAQFNFAFDVNSIFDINAMQAAFQASVFEVAGVFIWLLLGVSFASISAAIIIGGWNFSLKALTPKMSNMDPIKGLTERVFSVNGLIELVKALIKFVFIGGIGVFWIYHKMPEYIDLAEMSPTAAISKCIEHLLLGFFLLVSCTFAISAIDVPYQLYKNSQKLKMTKQEVRDEYKDSEGKPEVKSKVRQLQREIAQRKMMGNVPDADVVITNPEHFSVALRYKPDEGGAPKLIAKGADLLAFKIREVAKHHNIMMIESPLLCRAVFYTTEVDQEIPRGLYKAVAQVLAFVFQMNEYQRGRQEKPKMSNKFDIPEEFQFDSRGRQPKSDKKK